jgi:DNA topoisomerase I
MTSAPAHSPAGGISRCSFGQTSLSSSRRIAPAAVALHFATHLNASLTPEMRAKAAPSISLDPLDAARAARLRYVDAGSPGITRLRAGRGFTYRDADGRSVTDKATLQRIRSLVLPPAWTDVWICAVPNGHLQATGRDARGRKQYRYHNRWRAVRDEAKYDRLSLFAETLPRIRKQVDEHLSLPGLPREKLLAAIVWLLETTFIRVGNAEYARDNESFGLTTLEDRHASIEGSRIRFSFRGKSRKAHTIALTDRRIARIVKRSRDLPGQDLFQYLNDQDEPQRVNSADVNDYLRSISGEEFTAKDFRTWAGTILAARALVDTEPADTATAAKARIVTMIADVAKQLGNTPAICRKCYVHPAVIQAYQDENAFDRWQRAQKGAGVAGLDKEEATLLRFLKTSEDWKGARAA